MISESVDIPDIVPVMTLKGVVLFPKAMMPLRIFETRYRQMLRDVLQAERMFAIVAERENVSDEEAELELPFEVATVGLVRVSKKHDDGTSFVLLQGLERVKINSIVEECPYRKINVSLWPTDVDSSSAQLRKKLSVELDLNRSLGGEVSDEMIEYINQMEDDVAYVDMAIHTLGSDTLRKQAMLEVQNLGKRAGMLMDDLRRENKRLSLLKDALGKDGDDLAERN